jgi:hypothetical protein
MTTCTFIAKSSTQFVNWSDPSVWSGGVVPNGSGVDVVIPTITTGSNGQIYNSFLTEDGTYTISSLAISNNDLLLNGNLTVLHNVTVLTGGDILLGFNFGSPATGSLSVASLDNSGAVGGRGSINSSGPILNEGEISGGGLSLTAPSLNNVGTLFAHPGNLIVTISPGGFTNLSGSTLTGGTYTAIGDPTTPNSSGALFLNVGAVIATDAAKISLSGPAAIYSFDNVSGTYVPITASLHTIANSATLSLSFSSYDWSDLTVDGSVTLSVDGRSAFPTKLTSTHLTIDPHGVVSGIGTLSAPILNAGTIVAGSPALSPVVSPPFSNVLDITGPVSGSGLLKILPALNTSSGRFTSFLPATLELGAAASSDVVFLDNRGILILDNPSAFSGKIAPTGSGDQIVLRGISFSSVTGYSYSGDTDSGALKIQFASGEIDLNFSGYFATGSFTLKAGPQSLSSDPPSLLVTNIGTADFNSAPSGDFDGNGRSDLLWRNDTGQIAVWQTTSSGVLATAVALGSASASWHIDGTGDFNHDGHSDILFRNDDGTLAVWQTNGQQIQSINVLGSASAAWHSAGMGDFNGDGTSDLLFRNDNGQIAQWIINNNQIQSIQVLGSTSPAFHVVAISDFNGDGKADLLFRDNAGVLATWILDGNQLQSAQVIGSTSIDWHLVGTGDFNGDGKIDLLWRNDNGQVAEWLMNGAAIQSIQTVGTAGGQYHVDGTGDFNGDGRSDILFRDTGGTVVEWLMNGAAIQTAQVLGSASADFHISAHHFDLV